MNENNISRHIIGNINQDLGNYLKNSEKKIIIYGMGNGADKTISLLKKYGRAPDDFFASDDFVRGQQFHGKTVLKYSDIIAKYGHSNIIILVSFGSPLPEIISRVYSIAETDELYIPDVPVCSSDSADEPDFFDTANFFNHESEILSARSRLSDEESVNVFDNVIRFKITGKPEFLKASACSGDEIYHGLSFEKYRTILDLGAYRGDTLIEFTKRSPLLKNFIAVEPDVRSFKKLKLTAENTAESSEQLNIICENKAAVDRQCELEFSVSGNRNSTLSAAGGSYIKKIIKIPGDSPDNIVLSNLGNSVPVDFIKFDIEGAESLALKGSQDLIRKYSPDLLVSAYHKTNDLFNLINQINNINPDYKLYLRRKNCIPAWEINILAVSQK